MGESVKLLVAGDVNGKFQELFNRVNVVNKKSGPFQMLLCVGNFFPEAFTENVFIPEAPIPTFILGPINSAQVNFFPNLTGCELSRNVTYLGQRGVYTESSGLRIAYFSGNEAKGIKGNSSSEFDFEDVKNMEIRLFNEPGFKGVDILLTSQWPLGVKSFSAIVPDKDSENSSALISRLAISLKPRYHFCGLEGIHYERPPYRNHEVLAEASKHPTRFIALSNVGNVGKKKWLYAFNIVPMKDLPNADLVKQPPDVTENPYSKIEAITKPRSTSQGNHAKDEPKTASKQQFFYDSSYTGENNRNKRPHQGQGRGGGKNARTRPPPPGSCWFCLSSPEVEKHLVVSVGENVYLTLAKGGLNEDHSLILPIGHFQSTLECPQEVSEELEKFKSSIVKHFAAQNKAVVFYERNFRSPHLQIQAVPVPKEIGSHLKSICLDYAESEGIEMQDFPPNAELFQMTKVGFPYFFMELPDKSKLFCPIRNNFPLQFGRELLASQPILNIPDKIDWKNCKGTKDEESNWTKKFREDFKKYDFTLEEG